ncbi:MAG: LamG domain-containing protein [Planctomycetes bacterium]|nr:LamG domain-containing protein [Planctomycetota bacterium]
MPLDSRPVLGWMFSRGQNHSFSGLGDHLGLNDKGQLIFHNGQQIYIGETSVQRWRWHHAVLVRNGDRVQVFLDGQQQIDAQAKAYLATDLFFLGGRNDNQSNWEGRLDEVAIFDRVLQEKEIRSLVP